MTLGNTEFLALLTRVIHLHRECGLANSPYSIFKYTLSETDGVLSLEFSFPHIGQSVTVSYDDTVTEVMEDMLCDAERYLERSAVASTTAPNDND